MESHFCYYRDWLPISCKLRLRVNPEIENGERKKMDLPLVAHVVDPKAAVGEKYVFK
jgi:hypothetical protein